MEETQTLNKIARLDLAEWQKTIQQNIYSTDSDFMHTIHYYFTVHFPEITAELTAFGHLVASQLEPLVAENHLNLPRLEPYNGIGDCIEKIVHHPSYTQIGDIIYGSKLLAYLTTPDGLLKCLSLFFLSSAAGEAGHNCPIACSAGIIRVFSKVPDFPNKTFYLRKLIAPSYQSNFTGAQFLTEIQGGSDVGRNATFAKKENNEWRIYGEKWFCSNANAELIFVTARYDEKLLGTKGLGLFLIPAVWNNTRNNYTFRRLKDKLGTQTMATAEVDFHGAYAYAIGELTDGFRLVMENVLHLSRLFNAFCVLGMARRAYFVAHSYAQHRSAFSEKIINYPLIKEGLARIKAENTAMVAGIFATAHLQDQYDSGRISGNHTALLLRLLINIQKYLTAKLSVEHVHHALDVLAGNGAIETFSSLPRLLRDCIVCENWEGTHNILRMQVLKDIHKYAIDAIFMTYLRNQIDILDQESPQTQIIAEVINELSEQLIAFKNLDKELQILQIDLIVDRMAISFCALRLLFEALDQIKNQDSLSKLDCFQYFYLLHFDKKRCVRNKDYLALITRITLE